MAKMKLGVLPVGKWGVPLKKLVHLGNYTMIKMVNTTVCYVTGIISSNLIKN